tara:strand:- start:1058 stop:1444 length:387 start_codon:yes stop_codon:yes gene_type:complete
MTKEELQNCEGLTYLTWDMFDSPDSKGSGFRFMEREPVLILDAIVRKTQAKMNVELGYVSKIVADKMGLISKDSHRVGKAVRLRCVGCKKRMVIIKALVEFGIERIAVNRETIYFDTDDLKERAFYLW